MSALKTINRKHKLYAAVEFCKNLPRNVILVTSEEIFSQKD